MSLETSFRQLREANPVPDPALLTDRSTDLGALLIASKQRSAEMQTQELTRIETPQPPSRRPWLIAVTAAAAVILIGFLLIVPNLGGPSDVVVDEPVPTTTPVPPAPSVDVQAAFPTQVQNDQASRATIEFAGNAQALVEGGAHMVEIQMEIEESRLRPLDADLQIPDTSKFINHTGWKPEIPFEKTMQDLLCYWRKRIQLEKNFILR